MIRKYKEYVKQKIVDNLLGSSVFTVLKTTKKINALINRILKMNKKFSISSMNLRLKILIELMKSLYNLKFSNISLIVI